MISLREFISVMGANTKLALINARGEKITLSNISDLDWDLLNRQITYFIADDVDRINIILQGYEDIKGTK